MCENFKQQLPPLKIITTGSIKTLLGLTLSWYSLTGYSARVSCISNALIQAPRLIEYAFGPLDGFRVEINNDSARTLKSVKNQADLTENLTVIEVWGSIYKANYRTRFIFSTKSETCVLVGQEVLEVDHF